MAGKTSFQPSTAKTVLTIVFIVMLAPVGLIMMFKWMKWPVWIKGILTVVGIYLTIMLISAIASLIVALTDPYGKILKAQRAACESQCQNASNATVCLQQCLNQLQNPSK